MEEIKTKGESLNIKSDQEPETSKAEESNLEEGMKALGDEFDSTSKVPKVKPIGDPEKK